MSNFYLDAQLLASGLLAQYGESFTITLSTGSKVKVKGLFVSKKQEAEASITPLDITQRECVIEGNLKKKPTPGDTLTYEKTDYYVTNVEEIRPTSTTIVYKLTVNL